MAENSQQMEPTEDVELIKPPEKVELENVVQHLETYSKGRKLRCKEFWTTEWKTQVEEEGAHWKSKVLKFNLKYDKLKNENATLQKKYEQSLKKNEALKAELKQKLAASEAEKAAILQDHEAEKKRQSKMYDNECKRFKTFRIDVVNREEEVAQLQNVIKEKEQAILEKMKEFESALALKDQEIKKGKKELTQQRVVYEIKLQGERSTTKKERLAKEKIEATIEGLKAEICKGKEKQKATQAKIPELQEKIEEEKKLLFTAKANHRRQIKDVYKFIEIRDRRIVDYRIKAEARDKVLSKLQMKNTELERTIRTLEREVTALKQEREKHFKDIANEKSKSGTLKVSLNERIEMVQDLEARLEEEKGKHENYINTIKLKTFEYKQLYSKHETLKASHNDIKPEVKRCHRKVQELENKIVSIQCDIQNCVDIFHSPREFLPLFVKLKEKHLDDSKITEIDSQFDVFHRYIEKLRNTFEHTIASQKRDRDNLNTMLNSMKYTRIDMSRNHAAIEDVKRLAKENIILAQTVKARDKELKIAKRPVKSKVQCWLNKHVRRNDKVHPALSCTPEEEVQSRGPTPCFETPQKVSSEPVKATDHSFDPIFDNRCLPSPETSSPSPIPYFINDLPDGI